MQSDNRCNVAFVCTIFHNNKGASLIRRGRYTDALQQCSRAMELLGPLMKEKILACDWIPLPECDDGDIQIDPPCALKERRRQHLASQRSLDCSDSNDDPQDDQMDDSRSLGRQNHRQTSFDASTCQEDSTSSTPLWESRTTGLDGGSTSHTGEKNPKSEASAGYGFVFRDPIQIPSRMLSQKTMSEGVLMRMMIVVLFNLALSYHLSALHSRNWNQLLRAEQLYEYAFYLHLENDSGGTLLYSMALLNNLGVVYEMCNERDKSQSCFQNMLSTMMILLECQEAQNIKQWNGLWSNVVPLITHDIAAAAA